MDTEKQPKIFSTMSISSSSSSSFGGPLPLQKSTSYSSRRQWSMETAIADHRDLQAGSMGLSRTDGGQFALLGGRRCLALVNLAQDPHTVILRSGRGFKWDIASIRWSPHRENMAAISIYDRVELIQVEQGMTVVSNLKGHSHLLSDLDWNDCDPNVLVTASHDNYLHVWDIRTAPNKQKPHLSFNAMSSTGQARWNRHNGHVLASTHDGDIKLWDTRKPSLPTLYVSAHLARIFSLDWSRVQHDRLITSGQDCFVKFHDISPHGAKPDRSLKTAVAVWKARYTPFGHGLATVIVPQVHRNDHSLFLWNYHHLDFPVHSFVGHRDVILNFDWRRMPETNKEMQLVTWSKDHTLRLWQVDPSIQNQCGHEASTAEDNLSGSCSESPLDSPTEQTKSQQKPSDLFLPTGHTSDFNKGGGQHPERNASEEQSDRESTPSRTLTSNSLQQEFELLNLSLGSVKMEDVSSGKRSCKFTATVAANQVLHRVSLIVNFPLDYPTNVPPTFTFGKGTTLDGNARSEILKTLNQTAKDKVRRNRTCLEPCLRQLEIMLEQMPLVSDKGSESPPYPMAVSSGKPSLGPVTSTDGLMATFDNANVPYPRSSGARFCANGLFLVCFGRSAHQRPLQHNDSNKVVPTPRALSAYDARRQLMNQIETYHGNQQQQQRHLHSPSNSGFTVNMSNLTNMSSSTHNTISGISNLKSYGSDPQDMTRKGRFKVRKVKNNTVDDFNKLMHKDSNKSKSGNSNLPMKTSSHHHQAPQPGGALGTGRINIYDVSKLFPYSTKLGESYVLLDSAHETCAENSRLASLEGRPDLEKVWRVCARIAAAVEDKNSSSKLQDNFVAWTHHPMGRPMLTSIIGHYIGSGDFQTASMIACAFHHLKVPIEVNDSVSPVIKPKQKRSIESPTPKHSNFPSVQVFEPMATLEDKENSQTSPSGNKTKPPNTQQPSKKFWFMKPGAIPGQLIEAGSPYHTVTATSARSGLQRRPVTAIPRALPFNGSENNLEMFRVLQKSQRSNSWSDTFNDLSESIAASPTSNFESFLAPNVVVGQMSSLKRHLEEQMDENLEPEEKLLDPKLQPLYETLKSVYANLLYNWQCFQKRCEVIKNSDQPTATVADLGLVDVAVNPCPCHERRGLATSQPSNTNCQNCCQGPSMVCLLCGLPVRGLATVCFVCGHGGHLQHLQEWFQLPESDQCCIAPGCNCPCLQYLGGIPCCNNSI